MNSFYNNGYQETIQKGLSAVRSFRSGISTGAGSRNEQIERLKKEIESANAIVIGAGAGLSTAAGLTYSGERFEKYFGDFAARFGISDMYSGGFYPFPDEETRWALLNAFSLSPSSSAKKIKSSSILLSEKEEQRRSTPGVCNGLKTQGLFPDAIT